MGRTSAGPRAAGSGRDEAATAPESALGIERAIRRAMVAEMARQFDAEIMGRVFTVPMPPTVANRAHGSSRHWRVTEREKKAYWFQLDAIAGVCRRMGRVPGELWSIPAPPDVPFTDMEIRSAMVLRGHMDDDNAVSRHKWLCDWLVSRGYLASDRRTCVRWAAFPTQRVTRKEPPRITLTLSPREAA